MTRHLLSLTDLQQADLEWIVERGCRHSVSGNPAIKSLEGSAIGLLFTKTSTRTRTAFATATLRLGGHVVAFGPDDLQLNTGETAEDTGRVLGTMLDALVVRAAGDPLDLRRLAAHAGIPVINAMSTEEHPTQAISDLTFLRGRFGTLSNLRLLYIGEGNNTAVALSLALPRHPGCELHLRTPRGYALPESTRLAATQLAARCEAEVDERHHLDSLPPHVDVIYTTRWQTTGTTKSDPNWRASFETFRIDEELLARYPDAIFMHDLPAHRGDEVTAGVIDGPASVVFEQARTKYHSAMAVLEWCLVGPR